ncbi:MAG TPA: hypothetical protein VNN73_15235 [Blastocatellia bacterium]|nr:hypothetical protein [Blastocatellia bacterium]
MKRKTLNYRKAIAAVAAFAILVAQGLNLFKASAASAPDVNLSNEERNIKSFLTDLAKLDVSIEQIKLRGRITAQEKSRVATDSESVKRRVADFQSSVRSAIEKLKAAGIFQNLDAIVNAKVKSAKLRDFIAQNGGARRLLETALSRINELKGDIDLAVKALDGQASFELVNPLEDDLTQEWSAFGGRQLINASYSPAPGRGILKKVFKCLVSATAYVIAAAENDSADAVKVAEDSFDEHC